MPSADVMAVSGRTSARIMPSDMNVPRRPRGQRPSGQAAIMNNNTVHALRSSSNRRPLVTVRKAVSRKPGQMVPAGAGAAVVVAAGARKAGRHRIVRIPARVTARGR